jgi:hypothetical protein
LSIGVSGSRSVNRLNIFSACLSPARGTPTAASDAIYRAAGIA